MKKTPLFDLTCAALCLALALILPFVAGQIPQIGKMLLPMHIPVLLCGYLCGWPYALAVGAIAPLLRSLLVGAPVLFPNAVGMAVELAAYGVIAALLYRALPKKLPFLYLSLLGSMIGGRLIWGLTRWLLALGFGLSFPFSLFLAGAVTDAVPGIILQLVLVPPLVMALQKGNPTAPNR